MFKSILLLAVLCAFALAAPVATRSSTAVSLSKRRSSSSSSVSSSSSGSYKGRGTWFSDTTGSCDIKFDQSDMIVALNQDQMGEINGSGSKCGQKVRVSYGGKSQVLTIVDTCPFKYCNSGDLDLSQAAFKNFADMSVGEIQLEWSFV
ncbi:hypothetical protein BGZ93_002364 [Podila epicladia]|nr:hypothetical protein BGZ92_002717 [Podila epicladia]KAG0097619.1 hypothetical protein BGZ93_002364 [Podila epicladia]